MIVWLRRLALLFALTLSSAAMAAPTLVENTDESARNPYQQTLALGQSGCTGPCTFSFPKVAAHKRLEITHISCWLQASGPGGVNLVYLTNGALNAVYEFIPSTVQGNGDYIVVNDAVLTYVTAGQLPTVTVDTNTATLGSSSRCTLSGYTVSLTD